MALLRRLAVARLVEDHRCHRCLLGEVTARRHHITSKAEAMGVMMIGGVGMVTGAMEADVEVDTIEDMVVVAELAMVVEEVGEGISY